jgi:hypothetical protein
MLRRLCAGQNMEPENKAELSSSFVAGKDVVFFRAVWPTALRNLAMGHDPEDAKKPVYGPRVLTHGPEPRGPLLTSHDARARR